MVIVVPIVYLAATKLTWRRPPDPAAELFRDTRHEYQSLRMRRLASPDDVRNALDSMEFTGQGMFAAQQNALRDTLATVIASYYLSPSPQPYKAWRASQGTRVRPVDPTGRAGISLQQIANEMRIAPGNEGEIINEPATVEEAFDLLWRLKDQIGGGINRPVSICDSPPGLRVLVTEATAENPRVPAIEGGLTMDGWYGGVSMSSLPLFEPVERLTDVLDRHRRALVAVAGVCFEFADGTRRPVIFTSYYHPQREMWILHQVNMANYPPGRWVRPWLL